MKREVKKLHLSKIKVSHLVDVSTIRGGVIPDRSDRPDCPPTSNKKDLTATC
ncbi:hypothetical protein ACJD0Z_05330 [Flavobacteriaceae bacterium M23B6Z8]